MVISYLDIRNTISAHPEWASRCFALTATKRLSIGIISSRERFPIYRAVLIGRQLQNLSSFVSKQYVEHNPGLSDGLPSLQVILAAQDRDGAPMIRYDKLHRVLAEGNFVLSVCEGFRGGLHTSFYDLFRIENGIIVEHWDTTETVPPPSEWKNENGKF